MKHKSPSSLIGYNLIQSAFFIKYFILVFINLSHYVYRGQLALVSLYIVQIIVYMLVLMTLIVGISLLVETIIVIEKVFSHTDDCY